MAAKRATKKKKVAKKKRGSTKSVAKKPPATPAPGAGDVIATDREKARAARRSGRVGSQPLHEPEEQEPVLEEQALPPAVAASETSPADARRKRKQLKHAQDELIAGRDPVVLKMDEIDALRLEASQSRLNAARNRIKGPLVQASQRALDSDIAELRARHELKLRERVAEAFAADEEFNRLRVEDAKAVNSVFNIYEARLPEGHAVSEIKFEDMEIVSEYAPERRGKRLDVPKMAGGEET
jgi:hypothetical protein